MIKTRPPNWQLTDLENDYENRSKKSSIRLFELKLKRHLHTTQVSLSVIAVTTNREVSVVAYRAPLYP